MDTKEFFPMTSRELEYIKTVADEKSISAAARKLYIAQPSLSQSLQRIEENLGAHLFNRTPSGLTLTYAGKRCYQMACQVLKIYSEMCIRDRFYIFIFFKITLTDQFFCQFK